MSRRKDFFQLPDSAQAEVELKLRSLLETCQTYQIPMFATVAVENNEETTKYNRIVYGPSSHAMKLTDDQIRHHILIANGFHAVSEREDFTIDMSQFI